MVLRGTRALKKKGRKHHEDQQYSAERNPQQRKRRSDEKTEGIHKQRKSYESSDQKQQEPEGLKALPNFFVVSLAGFKNSQQALPDDFCDWGRSASLVNRLFTIGKPISDPKMKDRRLDLAICTKCIDQRVKIHHF